MKTIHKHIIILTCLIVGLIVVTLSFNVSEVKHDNNTKTVTREFGKTIDILKQEHPTMLSKSTPVPELITVFSPTEDGEVDWKTCIITEDIDILNDLFEEYESPETMYTTTRVHMRMYPNTDSESIMVLDRDTELATVADYNGWTRVVTNDGDYYYIWNQYLSEEKQKDTYLGKFKLTAYCSCSNCCGKDNGITASGSHVTSGRTVAMGGVPFGTKLLINDHVYTVEDRGTPYGHVDIYFDSHEEALQFGVKRANVYIVE